MIVCSALSLKMIKSTLELCAFVPFFSFCSVPCSNGLQLVRFQKTSQNENAASKMLAAVSSQRESYQVPVYCIGDPLTITRLLSP